jgi:hypothetical protein
MKLNGAVSSFLYLHLGDSVTGLMFGENTEEKIVQDLMDLTESWGLALYWA